MFRRSILAACALAPIALQLSSCGSPGGVSMTDDEARIWMRARAQNGGGVLDDQKYKIEFGEFGDSHSEDDVIEFAGGRFRSSASDAHEYGSGPYATKPINGGVEFNATCKSATGGSIWWHGTVRGDVIEGGFVTTVPDEKTMEYTFHGTSMRPGATGIY
jgi:hypothetical protein